MADRAMTSLLAGLVPRLKGRPGPLSGLRLVVTIPRTDYWFGRDLAIAKDHIQALRELGAEVLPFDTTPAYRSNRRKVAQQVQEVRRFRPNAAIGVPHALFPLAVQSLNEDQSAKDKNTFLDDLDLPTVLYWDHVLMQIKYLPFIQGFEGSCGVFTLLQRLFHHPRAYHFFPDSGHIVRVNRLFGTNFDANNFYVGGVPRDYFDFADRSRKSAPTTSVGFFGNLILTPSDQDLPPELLQIRQKALAAYDADWTLAALDCYERALDGLSPSARMRLELTPDHPHYWRFLGSELSEVANGEPRLKRLLTCGRPVTYFGGFADPKSKSIAQNRGMLVGPDLPPDKRLAAGFQGTKVALDVVTAPFVNGFSHKTLACFVSGGFMLTTRKADILSSLGDAGDAISYSSASELTTKLEYFLRSDRERTQLSGEIAARVRREYSTRALFARTIPLALARDGMN